MRIDFARSGGLAGLTMAVSIDTARLPPDAAAVVDAALSQADLAELAARPRQPAAGADRYQYDLTIERDGECHSLSFPESEVPPELRPVVDALVPLTSPR
jgi:hypothetical protein